MRRWPVVVSSVAAALCVLGAQAPQQQTFRSGIDVVAVDVRVIDRAGRPVADLRPDDFVATVGGTARTLVTADFVSYAVTTDGARPASTLKPAVSAPSSSPNTVPPAPGRTVVVVVDEENIRAGTGKWAADAAAKFIDRMQRDDRVGLIIPRSHVRIAPTTDHAAVKAALSHVVGHMAVAPVGMMAPAKACDEVYGPMDAVTRAPRSSAPSSSARQTVDDMRRRSLDSLRSLAALLDSLGTEPGPKTIVLVSEEMPVCDHIAERAELNDEFARVGEVAAKAQAMLYVFQLDRPVADVESAQPSSPRDRDIRSYGLETVVNATGGNRLMVGGRPDAPLDRVALEISGQYLLGFRSEPADRDGKAHPITVTVTRKGVRVYARKMFAYAGDGRR